MVRLSRGHWQGLEDEDRYARHHTHDRHRGTRQQHAISTHRDGVARMRLALTGLALVVATAGMVATGCDNAGPGDDIEVRLTPIHQVEVRFMESFPVQVGVYIQGGLPDGCTTFRDIQTSRAGNTVKIEVTNQRPKDAICTQVYGYFERNINLGSSFTRGQVYTVQVNDRTTTFTMP